MPDEEFGQRLRAFVVPEAVETVDEEALRGYVRAHLERYKMPRDFVFLEALPRNSTGKILKRKLPASLERGDLAEQRLKDE